jgi:DNA (cytosine-5)-methyltransferase 1
MATANKKNQQVIKVIELFAGVGGFRLGLDKANHSSSPVRFETVWSNQWEPSTNIQHASIVYRNNFGDENHSNIDITEEVKSGKIKHHDMIVGGFPCQDYSVARTLSQSDGIEGKKGVLWWEIYKILEQKKNRSAKYLLLENVDRLLKSPISQRGRDFAIMLSCLNKLGYAVEWRIVNAADYGMPQRRRRIFILGYKKGTKIYKDIASRTGVFDQPKMKDWIMKDGLYAQAFPVNKKIASKTSSGRLDNNLNKISSFFNKDNKHGKNPFYKAGVMFDGIFYTSEVSPAPYNGKKSTLGDILDPLETIPKDYFVKKSDEQKWKKFKGSKNETRKTKDGFKYTYSEGAMIFPDQLDGPSRTIVTGEGGATPSRFKHAVKQGGKLRRLTPRELERLCMFPPDWTKLGGISDQKRAFFMGNALVVGVITRIGKVLLKRIS